MQGLTDGPVKTYLFLLEYNTLEEAKGVAEQEDFSVKQAHANPIVHRDDRKMEAQIQWTSVTRGARALVLTTTRNCKNAIDVRRQGIMHMNAVPRARYHIPQETITAKRPDEVQGVGHPTLLRKRNKPKNGQGQ